MITFGSGNSSGALEDTGGLYEFVVVVNFVSFFGSNVDYF